MKQESTVLEVAYKARFILISFILLILGNALFNTIIAIKLKLYDMSNIAIGTISSSYYLGLTIASFKMEPYIVRLGHIRAYAALASLMTACSISQGFITDEEIPLLILRFIGGFCIGGLYIVIESWLLTNATNRNRGQILAIYMVCLYGSSAISQQFLKFASPETLVPFAITTVFTSLSIIPLALSPVSAPKIDDVSSVNIKQLFNISATGATACILGGCLQGVITTMTPLYIGLLNNYGKDFIANYMFFVLIGAMSLQLPIGKLSDVYDRRSVLCLVAILAVICSALSIAMTNQPMILLTLAFFIGGFSYSIYSIGISHTVDFTVPEQIVGVTQGLLLVYSFGATIAPVIVSVFTTKIGPLGFFYYIAAINLSLAIMTLHRFLRNNKHVSKQQEPFIATPISSPVISELDPDQKIKKKRHIFK